jgi:hypothetical protein
MAFPAVAEENARKEAEVAWASHYLQAANRLDETSAPFADPRLNELVKADPVRGRAVLRTAHRRLRDRMEAARSVRPWIRDWLDQPQLFPAGMKKFTQRQIALFLAGGNEEAAHDLQKRVLRPSRPVLHLAVAVDVHDLQAGQIKLDTGISLDDIDRFAQLVFLSNVLKMHICLEQRFRLREQDLLHLVWVQ